MRSLLGFLLMGLSIGMALAMEVVMVRLADDKLLAKQL
jgi:hypothetical protein